MCVLPRSRAMCAARVQYLPIRRRRVTLSVCGGAENFLNMLLTCQDQPRPPAVCGRAPGTVRVTRVVLRLVRRAHSVEAKLRVFPQSRLPETADAVRPLVYAFPLTASCSLHRSGHSKTRSYVLDAMIDSIASIRAYYSHHPGKKRRWDCRP